ncbi:MAG: hypothetical protein ABI831_10065 [Betaproteobacteria bacterium]
MKVDFDLIAADGAMERAFKLVQAELPPLSETQQAGLATQIYSAWVQAAAVDRIATQLGLLNQALQKR